MKDPMMIYVASACDVCEPENDWPDRLSTLLSRLGHTVFVPSLAWKLVTATLDQRRAETVLAINDFALLEANLLVARMDHKSLGVPREMMLAHIAHIPIIVVREDIDVHPPGVCELVYGAKVVRDMAAAYSLIEDYQVETI